MITGLIKFKNHPCFKKHWSGFEDTAPITLIIGKNNTGKSHLLQFIDTLCSKNLNEIPWDLKSEVLLDEPLLEREFRKGYSAGVLGGEHWRDHGIRFVGKRAIWTREVGKPETVDFENDDFYRENVREEVATERLAKLLSAVRNVQHPFKGKRFKHLYADRDIQPERMSNMLELRPNGAGATNIVRRFINSSDPKYPRRLIQQEMLSALNEIFGEDGKFREITVQHHDGTDMEKVDDIWEIFLEQEHKGLVSLSNSGSGLKTIFLVLLHLLVVPVIDGKGLRDYVFAFEELENNLHPSLVRNLLSYIKSKTTKIPEVDVRKYPQIFLTTHSNVALDFFAGDPFARIVHVSHDGESARTQSIDQSATLLGVIWDLGTRPSDLLQANGIIWVEGPSDRIYVNKWIELYSEGKYREGRHYQCAFYGGGLLSNLQVAHDEVADEDLINLLKINPNVVVVSDSDRKNKGAKLKDRVRRIREEFDALDKSRSYHWILEAREIENYLTAEIITTALDLSRNIEVSPEKYEPFFPKKNEEDYLLTKMERKTFDKSNLAALTAPHMTLEPLKARFDWEDGMKRIVSLIEVWNR